MEGEQEMSYFEEVEFELRDDPAVKKAPKKDIEFVDQPKLKAVIEEIEAEFEKIRTGNSDLTHYAINPGRFASPVASALTGLKNRPSFKAMRQFLQVAEQDLGFKAREHFKGLLAGTIKTETPNE
jgi:hypothetical protein